MSRSDLADFTYFLAIARHRSFRRAGLELGITASALSHALRGLEARLGVRLLNRTNRSVTLTAAGEELQAAIAGPFDMIGRAVDDLNRFRDEPTGRIRLNVVADAATTLLAPVLPLFVERYPGIQVDIAADNRMIDVIESGFDAGIRFGGTVPQDMISQRLSADIRWVVVASPDYLARHGVPAHPDDLAHHRCIRLRTGDNRVYHWELERGDEMLAIDVPGSLMVDAFSAAIALALRGTGLVYVSEPVVAPLLEAGRLSLVLKDWAAVGPGYHIYYSSRRHVPAGLRLLIDLIREVRPLGL